ncbi:MAG: TolC family protein [Candidatus Cryptobacteroides sp.]
MRLTRNIALTLFLLLALPFAVKAQRMTMDEAIAVARRQSVAALSARQSFLTTYWAWRSYKASRLPSLTLYGNLMNYNRSLVLLQNYEDGALKYSTTNNLQNNIGLRISQNVTFTGGVITAYSDLSRMDQFGPSKALSWYSQPISISYRQPLFAYNQFKWNKKIAPKEYERGKRKYIESMEQITINVVNAYNALILAQMNNRIARSNYENTVKMHRIAAERMRLGSVTRDEYLQLELRMLNDSISINETSVTIRDAQMRLNSILGYDESFEIEPVLPDDLPAVTLDYDMVVDKFLANSQFDVDNEISILQAEESVAKAKADRGITMTLNAKFGLTDTSPDFGGAYKSPLDQEVVGLSFSVPIFDWGLGKGKVQKAKAAEEVVRAQVEQSRNDRRRTIYTAVGQFNNQAAQCSVSRRAMDVAGERYELTMESFRAGKASVTDLNTARSENDSALRKYVNDISDYWNYYYKLRQYALYDFIADNDLQLDEDELLDSVK